MFDDSPGDSTNTVANLQDQCKNAIQNGSGRGWCTCPVSVIAPVIAGNKRMCLMIPTATETPLNSANWVQDLGSTTANVPITEVKVTLQNICTFSISARIPGGKTGDFSIDAGGGVIQVFAPENDPNQKDVHTLTVSFAGAAARTAPYMSKIPIIWSVEGLLDMKSEQATVNLTLKAKVN